MKNFIKLLFLSTATAALATSCDNRTFEQKADAGYADSVKTVLNTEMREVIRKSDDLIYGKNVGGARAAYGQGLNDVVAKHPGVLAHTDSTSVGVFSGKKYYELDQDKIIISKNGKPIDSIGLVSMPFQIGN